MCFCVPACVPVYHQAGDTMCGVVVLDLKAPCDLASITLHVAGVASADFEVHVAKEHGVALGGSGRYSTSPKRRQGCLAWHRVDKIQRRRNVQVNPNHVCTPCLHSGDGGACRVRELRPLVTLPWHTPQTHRALHTPHTYTYTYTRTVPCAGVRGEVGCGGDTHATGGGCAPVPVLPAPAR